MSNERSPAAVDEEPDEPESQDIDETDTAESAVQRRDALKLLGAGALAGGALGTLPEVTRADSAIQKLTAPDSGEFDHLGSTVALDGDTALVGALDADTSHGEDAGAAYVFTRDEDDDWSYLQKLVPEEGHAGQRFGSGVAVKGDRAVIGADSLTSESAGAAYVFTRDDTLFDEGQKLTASDTDTSGAFGITVALSDDGTTVLVGALGAEVDGESSGAAYVFRRDADGDWDEEQKLSATDASKGDGFGSFEAVALDADGSTALVGDELKEDDGRAAAGAAYVFRRDGGAWPQEEKLTPGEHADKGDQFGSSVALDDGGTVALVGAPFDDVSVDEGAVHVFSFESGDWNREDRLTASDGSRLDSFGFPVEVTGDGHTVLTGANLEDEKGGDAGSAYVFTRDAGSWAEDEKLTASDPDAGDEFGSNVAIDGETGLVGAEGDNEAAQSAGAAYVFEGLSTLDLPSLEVGDFRPIQTVEHSMLRDKTGDDEAVAANPPDLVAGQNMSVLFNLEDSRNFASLPETTRAEVEVTRHLTSGVESDTFELDYPELLGLASDSSAASEVFDANDVDLPVFEATSDLNEIEVTISPVDGGGADFSGDSRTVDVGDDREIQEMDDLTIGFIEIQDPTGGKNYGDADGQIKDDIDTLVEEVTDYFGSTYPIDELTEYVHPDRLPGLPSIVILLGGGIVEDLKTARNALEDEFPDVDFDVTIAFVPEGYPNFYGDGFNGKHFSSARAAAAVRGDLRKDIRVEELHTTSAQEVGHHFLGEVYPDKLSMRSDGDIDNAHARTEPPDSKDDKYIDSTGFDLADGSYELVDRRLESFMSYNFDEYPMWADTHAYQGLIDSGLEGHPSSDGDSGRSEEPIVEGVGRLASDDTTTFTRVFKKDGIPKPSVADGAVTVTVRDATDEPIDSRTYPDKLEFDRRTPEIDRSHGTDENVFAFAVPFPETAASIEAERNGTVTRLNPIERSLRAAIDRLPDAAFRRAARGRRKALTNKLDDLDEKMAAGEYQAALNKLEKDIRDKLEKWIQAEYETGALQPTKTELLDLVDEMIARLETLLEASNS